MAKKFFGLILIIGGWTFLFYFLKKGNTFLPFVGLIIAMFGIPFLGIKEEGKDKSTED